MDHTSTIAVLLSQYAFWHLRVALRCLDALGMKIAAVHAETALQAMLNDLKDVDAANFNSERFRPESDFSILDEIVEDLEKIIATRP